jgi:hypothetical protein
MAPIIRKGNNSISNTSPGKEGIKKGVEMGFNTTVVILNDALDAIENDPDFGKNLVAAINKVLHGGPVDVSAGCHYNAATVIETHHADYNVIVSVGGNYGKVIKRPAPYYLLSP